MCHVLVIEDDFLIADHIMRMVEGAGATSFDQAATEKEAVVVARAHRPALILSDVRLAEGTGPAAVQTILNGLGPLPVIFLTGTPEECRPCDPPMVVLDKPIRESVLVETFKSLAPL